MNEISLEALGLDQDKLAEKLVDRIAENLLTSLEYDEENGEWRSSSPFAKKLDQMVKQRLDQIVNEIAEAHILPMVGQMVETVVFQETNGWGEPKKPPMTFREYLASKAENWMREKVNYNGKTRGEDSYNWSEKNTRIGYMVHQHLDYHIQGEMKKALSTLNEKVTGGLNEAIRMQIAEVLAKLK